MIIPFILAGGSGTRLWPLSRTSFPKPLTSPFGGKTLLQETALRVTGDEFGDVHVVCNENIRFLVAQQLQDIGISQAKIFLEGYSRNTAAAICLSALLTESLDDFLLFLPADHLISPDDEFIRTIMKGCIVANTGKIVIFGIPPRTPSTQYGYIRDDVGKLTFVEKPNLNGAQILYKQENIFWNSGIVLAKPSVIIEEFRLLMPELFQKVKETVDSRYDDLDFVRFSSKNYGDIPSISFDHAILEKTKNLSLIKASFEWSDIGNWDAIWEASKKDENSNVSTSIDSYFLESNGCYVHSDGAFVSLIGVKDHVVISQQDVVLVLHKDEAEKVKEIPKYLTGKKRTEAVYHTKNYRPWGDYETISETLNCRIRKVFIKSGYSTAVQIHNLREELWVVLQGTGASEINYISRNISRGDTVNVPKGYAHRLINSSEEILEILEIQFGDVLSDDDVIRIESILKL